jgi:flagellar biosynthesis regulator FlaF
MSQQPSLSLAEEQAFQLSQAAILLDQTRSDRETNIGPFAAALKGNLDTWVALCTVISHEDCMLTEDVKRNLRRLAQFVADKTLAGLESVTNETIDSFININLQISEGLLEGAKAR